MFNVGFIGGAMSLQVIYQIGEEEIGDGSYKSRKRKVFAEA